MSFKMAGALGFREAMEKAGPVLLEPISRIEVTVPTAYQGDVMGDLNSRRGRVQGTEVGADDESIVTALVPTSEILRYAIDLRSMTGGRGGFHAEHDHYDPLPHNLWDQVKREPTATEPAPPGDNGCRSFASSLGRGRPARRPATRLRRGQAARTFPAETGRASGRTRVLGDRGHEVGVAVPPGQDVHVEVARHPRSRRRGPGWRRG